MISALMTPFFESELQRFAAGHKTLANYCARMMEEHYPRFHKKRRRETSIDRRRRLGLQDAQGRVARGLIGREPRFQVVDRVLGFGIGAALLQAPFTAGVKPSAWAVS